MSGNGYMVTWTFGNMLSLAMPKDYGMDRPERGDFPINPAPFRLMVKHIRTDTGWIPDINAVLQLKVIEKVFDACESIIAATDASREGEMVFRYLYRYLECRKPYRRLWISSLTDEAVLEGMGSLRPGSLYDRHRPSARHHHRLETSLQPYQQGGLMDRLIEAIEAKQNPSVVGLDPTEALVPAQIVAGFAEEISEQVEDPAEAPSMQLSVAFFEFNRAIIDAVADIVPAVKPQIAMYETLGPAGIDAYTMTCEYAKQQGLYVLGDVKRGDIGSTAAAYAHHLSGIGLDDTAYDPWHEDAVTVNPYLGTDGITPFVDAATANDKDIFVLVRTSNPSSSELQELELASGERVYEHVADLVEGWGAETIGKNGYSRVGAVVGATHPEEGKALRARMPHTFFLVPGYGAQGGTAQGVAGMFDRDGMGALVNSSRGVIGAWKKSGKYSESMSADDALDLVAESAREAAKDMRDNLRAVLP